MPEEADKQECNWKDPRLTPEDAVWVFWGNVFKRAKHVIKLPEQIIDQPPKPK